MIVPRLRQSWFVKIAVAWLIGLTSAIAVMVGAARIEAAETDKPLAVGRLSPAKVEGAKAEAKDGARSGDNSPNKIEVGKSDAAKPSAAESDASGESKVAKPAVGSPEERSATALSFVREHHPELVELLERLKRSNGSEYERAIRELARTSDRLSGMRARNPERYALELDLWKLKSQIQLLSARASLAPNEDLTSELRALIERQLEVRAAQLELERSELTERLDRVELALQAAETNHQSQLDKQLNDTLRSIDVARKREADRQAKKTPPAGNKAKRDKKETKKAAKPEGKADAKPDAKKEANKDAKKEVPKEINK
jgi:hypothetical protein